MLLYNGRFNEKHDFIALEIISQQIQLTFSAGGAKIPQKMILASSQKLIDFPKS